jgi:hypothetical protein
LAQTEKTGYLSEDWSVEVEELYGEEYVDGNVRQRYIVGYTRDDKHGIFVTLNPYFCKPSGNLSPEAQRAWTPYANWGGYNSVFYVPISDKKILIELVKAGLIYRFETNSYGDTKIYTHKH